MLFVFLVNDKLYKIGLLGCWVVGLLDCWIVGLLDYGSRENKEIYRCMG